MKKIELAEYIASNSEVQSKFESKAMEYQQMKNDKRPKAKQWNEAKMQHAVERMYGTVLDNVHNKIKPHIKPNVLDQHKAWSDFMEKNAVLEELEESMGEIEFE